MNERMIQWLRRLLLCAATVICPLSIVHCFAQEDMRLRQICSQAENNMQIGRTDEARDTLLLHMNAFKGTLKRDALRMIAMSYLTDYDEQKAGEYVKMMLEVDPYYSVTTFDPPIFVDIVNKLKAGKTATVTTASNMEESLDEVPVPTTLITEEMIHNCGGRNLQEVLAAYVPGMNLIDCNDGINIAMRGIYSNMQEKILFLLNGHRLNSYLSNAALPDFSMSLEKIRQIEVLRGPASSIYGGVALTAVVNIITKQGADVDGIFVKAEGGNHGQVRGDILFGKRYFDLDVLAWLSAYHSKGEQRTVSEEHQSNVVWGETVFPVNTISIGRIGRPNYDIGVQLTLKGWQLLYNVRYSQVVAPYTFASTAYAYDYDKYTTHKGIGPSLASLTHHANVSYQWSMFNVQWKAAAFYDNENMTQYQVLSETPNSELMELMEFNSFGSELYDIYENYNGLSRCITGQGQNVGLQLTGGYDYALGSDHKGSLVFGAEYSHFVMEDVRYRMGYDYVMELYEGTTLRQHAIGRENSANASLQLKHQWRSLILNAGLRYDHKHRFDDTDANEWSPRFALILLQPKWNLKFSYSKSFVDAPYFYRVGNLMQGILQDETLTFVEPLTPERMHSWQLSFAGNNWLKGLHFEVNGFYNRGSDLIMTNFIHYANAGKNHTAGVEIAANYQRGCFSANLDVTWAHTFKSNIDPYDFDEEEEYESDLMYGIINANNNTPAITSNLVLTWQATPRLNLHAYTLFESKQSTYYYDLNRACYALKLFYEYFDLADDDPRWDEMTEKYNELGDEAYTKKDMAARAIVNVGADYQIGKLTLGLNVHNLFDTRYDRSGTNTSLVPQQGRWWTVSASYKF